MLEQLCGEIFPYIPIVTSIIKLVTRTFMLSLHAFRLLFLRSRVSIGRKWLILVLGWAFVGYIVAMGPLAIEKKTVGPYFGPSGYWYATYCLFQSFTNSF